ncbi:MAG: homoserine kinase [Alphaproteobacteria bacterium]|nr:homoserine kinase [Alphaproteobacteria bacterium]
MAVYTEVSFEDLERLLQEYDVGAPLTFKGIAEGVENSNFYLQTDRGAFILTLYEKRVSSGDLPFYLGLMEHLSRRGIVCPLPVPTREGALSSTLNRRSCAVVTFLNGLSVRRPTAAHCAGAGAALARLHLAGEGFGLTRTNALGPSGWKPLAEACDSHAEGVENGLAALIREQRKNITEAWPALPGGVIHADFFPDNVLFMREEVSGIIDFYFACNDMFAYDLAVTLSSWCFESDGSYNLTKSMALIQGYRSIRELSREEVIAMPVLMRGAALRFLLTRLFDLIHHDPNALVSPKDPREYSKKLRFHMKVKDAREYGF